MTFRYHNETEDVLAFTRWHLHHFPLARQQRRRGWLVLPSVLLLGGGLLAVALPQQPLLWGTLLVLALVYVIAFPLLLDAYVLRAVRRQVAAGKDGRVGNRVSVSFSARGISYQPAQELITHAWPNVLRIEEDARRLYLYLSESQVLIIAEERLEGCAYEEVVSVARAYYDLAAEHKEPVSAE